MPQLLIKNARLEAGFEQVSGNAVQTLTESKDLLIKNGRIAKVSDSIPVKKDYEVLEAAGLLLMPAFREMHIHLDKTYFGGSWKAPKSMEKGIFTRIEEELEILPEQLPVAEERAHKIVELLLRQGHTHIRTHCNIDPGIKLENLEITLKVLEEYKNDLTYEIVAFPQHGLLRSGVEPLMREAMWMGATHVGGVDPATVDRDIDRSLETIIDIAVQGNKGIDLHLHEPDTLGMFTFEKLAKLTQEAKLENKVTISHAFALGDSKGDQGLFTSIVQTLAAAGIDVTTTVPIQRPTLPLFDLVQSGVPVSVGHDSFTDHWSPFGTGNTIEKLCLIAERFRYSDELSLSQLWQFASGGINPLDEKGTQQWPTMGDEGDVVLVDASCSAEAVARRKSVVHTVHGGRVIKEDM